MLQMCWSVLCVDDVTGLIVNFRNPCRELELIRNRCTQKHEFDLVWKHDDVAETVWSIDDVEITWNEDQFNSDAEADADALASAGWGTDEDYGGCCDW